MAKKEEKLLENELTPSQMEEIKQDLTDKANELRRKIVNRGAQATESASETNIEDFDKAAALESEAVSFRVLHKERKLLRLVEKALDKFKTGEFGFCEGTGDPIGFKRLKVVPWAKWSVEYKEELEHKERLNTSKLPGR